MKEQLVNDLLTAVKAQTIAQTEQTKAINRLAESNEALVAIICQAMGEESEIASLEPSSQNYLSGKPQG